MSGVVGTPKISSRDEFKNILNKYTQILNKFPGFVDIRTSGSYNSDLNKTSFGDMDLIVTINSSSPKSQVKKDLAKFLLNSQKLSPFVSSKYAGKMYYNSGEIITVNFMNTQIDNIVALSKKEADFKQHFLDLPAEKQGLLLGLMKTVFIEGPGGDNLLPDQELAYNLSSKELQLRKITYYPGTFKEKSRVILETYNDWGKVMSLVKYDFTKDFEEIVTDIKQKLLFKRSTKRLQGVFKSMVSIKSGEVGNEKGHRKQRALDVISKL